MKKVRNLNGKYSILFSSVVTAKPGVVVVVSAVVVVFTKKMNENFLKLDQGSRKILFGERIIKLAHLSKAKWAGTGERLNGILFQYYFDKPGVVVIKVVVVEVAVVVLVVVVVFT